jgi:hypothetical protein
MNIKLAIQKKFGRRYKEEQIDVVTKLTTGKAVKDLAEDALGIATEKLTDAEFNLGEKEAALEEAQTEHRAAAIDTNLRKKDFNTVADILEQ